MSEVNIDTITRNLSSDGSSLAGREARKEANETSKLPFLNPTYTHA